MLTAHRRCRVLQRAFGRNKGNTLVEVAIALLLLGVAALATIDLLMATARAERAAWQESRAIRLAGAAAEALRAGLPIADTENRLRANMREALVAGGGRIIPEGAMFAKIGVFWRETDAARSSASDALCRTLRPAFDRTGRRHSPWSGSRPGRQIAACPARPKTRAQHTAECITRASAELAKEHDSACASLGAADGDRCFMIRVTQSQR